MFKIGLIVFALGMFINIYSDYSILKMKKEKGAGYHIPQGFLHRSVSSPNYLGEIIEWLGWAILTWSISGLVFFIWTVANLFPRAIANHQWYQTKFENYPKNRKAIIPQVI
jgi:steroid 5-alpha reductase family enzyme